MKMLPPLTLVLSATVSAAFAQTPGITTRVSVSADGQPSTGLFQRPSMSADGRLIVFSSTATNLVANDTNGMSDVFVRDRQAGTTTRVSVTSNGIQANGSSRSPSMSSDGRYIAFVSNAKLVSLDGNGFDDIYVHDRQTGATTRVSVSTSGRAPNSWSSNPVISANGRFVAFQSRASNLVSPDTNAADDIFVRDLQTNETTRVSLTASGAQSNGGGVFPAISADGAIVAFLSSASNLVASDINQRPDVFVRDRGARTTTRVSVATEGAEANEFSWAPAISGDGRIVAFPSLASNLVTGDTNANWDVFVHDRQTAETTRVSVSTGGAEATIRGGVSPDQRGSPAVSSDGRFIVFLSKATNLAPDDRNAYADVFIRDRLTGRTTRAVTMFVDGESWAPSVTPDGRVIAFGSGGSNLPGWESGYRAGIFVHDRFMGTSRVSVANDGAEATGACDGRSVDATGRYVVFSSAASNLVPNDTNNLGDVFVRDRLNAQTTRVSVRSDGGELTNGSSNGVISADGRIVAFQSEARNVVDGDTNGFGDIFVRDLVSGQTSRVNVNIGGGQANSISYWPSLSADGRLIAFISYATNLVTGDTNAAPDVFVHDRQTGETARVSVGDDGTQGNSSVTRAAISGDGRFVAFASLSSNLVVPQLPGTIGIYVRDRQTNRTTRIDVASDGTRADGNSGAPSISADGRYVAFETNAALVPADTNGTWDIYVHDRTTRETTRVSVPTGGGQADAMSGNAAISGDGRYVAFEATATNLVSGDTNALTDIFVHDRTTGETWRVNITTRNVSIGPPPEQASGGDSQLPAISADGRVVAFQSRSDSLILVYADTNDVMDVFVHERRPW